MRGGICFFVTDYDVCGGVERVVSQLANGLAHRDYDVSIVSLGKGLHPYFETDKRVRLFELDQINPQNSSGKIRVLGKPITLMREIRRVFKLKRLLKKIQAQVVLAEGVQLYRYLHFIKRSLGIQVIACEHGNLDSPNFRAKQFSRDLAIKSADRVIVLGDKDLAAYQEKYPQATNLRRIYNPVSFEAENKVDVNNKIVIAAGRYAWEKGFDMLIDSWGKIASDAPEWELRIFGGGEESENLQRQIDAQQIPNVKLCGFTADLAKEFEKASIFALSSRTEGFVLVLIEALAKGLPCVSFNCKQGPSEIIEDGVNGFLVTPNDTEEFSQKLLKLMQNEDLRRSFSLNSHNDLQRFRLESVLDEWIKEFEALKQEKTRGKERE